MRSDPFFVTLRRVLDPEGCEQVVSALRQDEMLWDALCQPEVFSKCLEQIGANSNEWTPASIALKLFDDHIDYAELKSLPMQPVSNELRKAAVHSYEETYRSGNIPLDLKESALVALALRERRRLTGTWEGLPFELNIQNGGKINQLATIWQTPLAICYGMIPDPADFLVSLTTTNVIPLPVMVDLVNHIVLTQPVEDHVKSVVLLPVISAAPEYSRMIWLEGLIAAGQDRLAAILAEDLIQTNLDEPKLSVSISADDFSSSGKPVEFTKKFDELSSLRNSAGLFSLAGQSEYSLRLLQQVSEGIRCIYSRILSETAAAARNVGDQHAAKTYLQKGVELAPELDSNRVDLAVSLGSEGSLPEALQILESAPAGLVGYITTARLALETGELDRSRLAAQNALHLLESANVAHSGNAFFHSIPGFIDDLITLDLPEEASRVACLVLKMHGSDPDLHSALSRANTACRNLDLAAESAQMALSLRPADLELHRSLAASQEVAGFWEDAYTERKSILNIAPAKSIQDRLALARCAVNTGSVDEAITICEEVTSQDPENGLAHAIQGQSLKLKGNNAGAVDHLKQATYLAPDLHYPWLTLAEIHEDAGSQIEALETLRAGALAAPLSAEIHQALAESYLQNGSPSEALPALRKAAQLDPNSASIAIRLGDILRSVGHLDESASVLKRALRHSGNNAELGFELAKTSITAGNTEDAISALEIKLASAPADPEPYLLYARLLLDSSNSNPGTVETSCRLNQAEHALLQVLATQPEDLEAGVLLADVLTAGGRTQEALVLYQDLAEKYQDHSPSWSWRIKLGLGKAALDLDQVDLALAAMQEAARLNPENITIQRTLAETYFAANLLQEAMQAGNTAVSLSSDDPAILMWFAGLACACGALNDSISTLEHAAELSESTIEPYLRLAQVEILANNPPAARSALNAILHNTTADAGTMQKTAYLYLQAGDIEAAEECLLKATETQGGINSWFELARVQQENGQNQASLDTVRTAIALHPADPRLHVLQAELLAGMGQFDEGLESLKRVSDTVPAQKYDGVSPLRAECAFPPISVPAIFVVRTDRPAVLSKAASLLRSIGDLNTALEKSLQALEAEPANIQFRKQAVSLAHAMLDLNTALSLVPEISTTNTWLSKHNDPSQTADLLCAMAEVHLDLVQYEEAAQSLMRAEQLSPSFPRILVNQSYLAGVHGDFLLAEQLLETAIRRLDDNQGKSAAQANPSAASSANSHQYFEYPVLAIAQAALQIHQWGLAMPLIEQALRSSPNEARVHLTQASAVVLAQEAYRCRTDLKLTGHLPAPEYTGVSGEAIFDREIEITKRICSSSLIDRWQNRGTAVFHPDRLDMMMTGKLAACVEDAPALLWALKETSAIPELLDTGKTMLDEPNAMLPYALALLPDLPEQSLTIAKKMAGLTPDHPLHQAALAVIAGASNDEVDGLQAIEQALQIWPDEPEWHVIAANLSAACGDASNELRHWEQAHILAPENTSHMIALGRSYLASRNFEHGMEILEKGTITEPGSAEVWLALSEACIAVSNYERAFTCAEKAAILDPDRPEPRLISGKIALEAGQLPVARLHAEAVLLRDPGEPAALLILAKARAAEGSLQGALNFIENSIPAARDAYPLLIERVALLKKLGAVDEAIKALQELSAAYPREAVVLKDLAEMLAASGNKNDAEAAAQAALRLQPYQPDLHLLAGSLQRETGQLDQAVYHLSEAVHQNPGFVDGYLELGKTYMERRETAMAIEILQQAIAVAPQDARPYFQSALVLKDTKDYVGAEKMLRKAASLDPDDVTIRRQLGALIALNLVHNPLEAVR